MKIRIFIFFCLLLLPCLWGCRPKKNYIVKVKLIKLTPDNIYDKEFIGDFLFDAEEMQTDTLRRKAEKLFLKGIDTYKNKKDAWSSIDLFKRSLLIYPSAKTYYTLGNALIDAHLAQDSSANSYLRQALDAYNVAEYLKFQPLSQVYYHKACAENLLWHIDSNLYDPFYSLERAFAEGFTDTTALKKNKNINSIVSNARYKALLGSLVVKNAKSKPDNFFTVFKKSFPVISQPFEITADKVAMLDYKETMSYDFAPFIPEMENTQFGRNVASDYYYVGKIAETPLYTAVLYFNKDDYAGTIQPIYTRLVTYDTAGNIISLRLFACEFTPEKIRTGKIENNEITLQDYKRIWKYNADSLPEVDGNTVIKYVPLAKATFRLTESGKIIKVDVPTNYSDSTLASK